MRLKGSSWRLDMRPHGRFRYLTREEAERDLRAIERHLDAGDEPSVAIARVRNSLLVLPVAELAVEAQDAWKEEYRRRMWQVAKRQAEKARLPFSIRIQDVVFPDLCPVLGLPREPTEPGHGRSDAAPSLDRIHGAAG